MYYSLPTDAVLPIFEQSQTDFGLEEHQWHTECCIEKYSLMIYIIAYSTRHWNPFIDHVHTFADSNRSVENNQ